jgi:hypothetical protein
MKRIAIVISAIAIAASSNIQAFDIRDALKKLPSGGDVQSSLGSIGDALSGVLTTDKMAVADLAGQWKYKAPAVVFKSDNLLEKAGGAAAAGVVESKLEPFYKTFGVNSLTMTVKDDGTFEMKVRGVTLKGTITQNTDEKSLSNFVFAFQAAKYNIGSVNAYVEKSAAGTVSLTFDVSKLISILESMGKVVNNSSIKSLTALLSKYDGLCAGFELTK